MKQTYKIELNGKGFIDDINARNFEDIALAVFRHQYKHNSIYQQFTDALQIDPQKVDALLKIPFLPVSFSKRTRLFRAMKMRSRSLKAAAPPAKFPAGIM